MYTHDGDATARDQRATCCGRVGVVFVPIGGPVEKQRGSDVTLGKVNGGRSAPSFSRELPQR
jgi:hypothetical protein